MTASATDQLFAAIEAKDTALIRAAIRLGAEVNALRGNTTPLRKVLEVYYDESLLNEVVEMLLEAGADPFLQVKHHGKAHPENAAIAALWESFYSTVMILDRYGYGVDKFPAEYSGSPHHVAAASGDLTKFEYVIDKLGWSDEVDKEGDTLLLSAVLGHNIDIVRRVLARGVDVDACGKRGITPLVEAFNVAANDECVALLVEHGADWTRRDAAGKTARELALEHDMDIIENHITRMERTKTAESASRHIRRRVTHAPKGGL